MQNLWLLINLIATWYMVGLIWMVQIVHYAMFDRVGLDQFSRYASDHARLITPIVGVPMLIELATALMLVAWVPAGNSRSVMLVALLAIILIWLSTALIQVPCHESLSAGFDADVYRRLVSSNWIRTSLWTARGFAMAYATWQLMKH